MTVGHTNAVRNFGEPLVTVSKRACNLQVFCSCQQGFWLEHALQICKNSLGEPNPAARVPPSKSTSHKGATTCPLDTLPSESQPH